MGGTFPKGFSVSCRTLGISSLSVRKALGEKASRPAGPGRIDRDAPARSAIYLEGSQLTSWAGRPGRSIGRDALARSGTYLEGSQLANWAGRPERIGRDAPARSGMYLKETCRPDGPAGRDILAGTLWHDATNIYREANRPAGPAGRDVLAGTPRHETKSI